MDYSELSKSNEIVTEDLREAFKSLSKMWEEWASYTTMIEMGYSKAIHERTYLSARLYEAIEAADSAMFAIQRIDEHLKFIEKEESKS